MFKLGKESAAPEQTGASRENSGKGWLSNHWCALALLAIIVVAFALRTVFAYGISADGDFALSGGSSAQYHLHVVESILNGSFALTDSAVNYPIGGLSVYPPLNDFLAAGVASVLTAFGMGSTEAASAALAVISPVLGALTCIPVFLVAREMFDRKVGVVAALLLAFLPLAVNATVFSNGNPYGLAMFLIAFMSYFMVRMVRAADSEDASRKAVLVNAALAGVFLLLAALTWNGFRFAAVLIAVAMVAQIVADRLRGRDFTTVLLGYTVTMVVGIIVPAVYYIPAGLWDAVFSGPLLVAVISLALSFVFMALRTKPWVLVIPGLVVAFVVICVALALAAPALFDDFFFGNSIYTGLMDGIAGSHVSMSNVSAYYGWVTMWLPICYALYSLYVYLRRDRSATRLLVTVWMFVMFFAVWTSAANAAAVASVFAVGSAAVIVRVIQAATLREWWGEIRAAGFPGALRKVIRPFPLATVIVAVFLIAVPNVSYAIDAGISNNDDADYYFSGNTQYTIKTGDSYPLGEVWEQYDGADKDGALATWLDYTYDAVTQGGFDSVTDTLGGGASAVSQMLLAEGAGGTTAAMMLRIMMSHDADYSSAFADSASVYQTVSGYIDDPAAAKAAIRADPETYGYVDSDITDENAVYLASIQCITSQMNERQIMEAYEAVCDASGDSIGYILMDGSMLPLQYGDNGYFPTLAYFADYSLDGYGAASQFFTYNTYYGYTNYTSAIYDTFLWRSLIGPSASEAGYSSSYSYLVALSASDGSEGSAMAVPGYGLEGYEVGLWLVRYNADSDATVSSDGWAYMDGYEAIAKQKAEGGVINYLSGIVMMEYTGVMGDGLNEYISGNVSTEGGAVDGATVSVYQYSDVYGRYVLYSETRTINGNFDAYVPQTPYILTVSNGDVVLRSFSSEQGDVPGAITIDPTSVEGSVVVGDDVYGDEDMRLILTGEAGVIGADGKAARTLDVSIADGTISIPSILPGTYAYTLYGEDGTSLGTGNITVSTGENAGLEIHPTTRTITATVNDIYGDPADGGVVVATNESTGAQFQAEVVDGKAVISALSGRYTLSMGEGMVAMHSSTVNVSSGNRTATVTAYTAKTVTVSDAPEGILLTASAGKFSTVSYVSEETGAVQFDIPVGIATDSMQYTIYGYSGGQIYHAAYTGGDSVALTADTYVEVSGTLKDGDEGESGTVRFIIEETGEAFAVATDSEGAYTALIPEGSYAVSADNGSNKAYLGLYTTGGEDKDFELVDGRGISYTFRWDRSTSGSNGYLPFVLGIITLNYNDHDYKLYGMTGTDGVVRFYIPDNVVSHIYLNNLEGKLDNELFSCIDMDREVSSGTSNNSATITIDPYKFDENWEPEEKQEPQHVKPMTFVAPYDMTLEFYESGYETLKLTAGEERQICPGQYTVTIDGETGYYYDGTAYLRPGQTEFTGLDVEEVVSVEITRAEQSAITIETDGGSYHSSDKGYYLEVGYEYYITVSATGGAAGLGYAYVDLTGETHESEYSFDLGTLSDRIEVTGNVGIVADGTITVSYGDVKHQFEVADGAYTLTLPGSVTSVEAAVEVSSTIDSEDYYYEATGTLDGLKDGVVRNLPVVSGDAPEADPEEEEEDAPGFAVSVSDEKFANGAGSFTVKVENKTDRTVTYNITGGSALILEKDFSVTVANGETGTVEVRAFYDATRFAPGSDGFSITVSDISGSESETVDITGGADPAGDADCDVYLMGQDGSEFNDRLSAYEYMYALTIQNRNVHSHDITVNVAGVPEGWAVTLMNEDGTIVVANGGTITVHGLQTTVVYVKLMLLDYEEGASTAVPAITASVSVDGTAQDYQLESKNASVTTDSTNASRSDVYNERSGVPVGIWFLVAVIILLLVIVFWLASKRGVFSRR